MPARTSLIGIELGRLKIVADAEDRITKSGRSIRMSVCDCQCGRRVVIASQKIIHGYTKSCGCLRREVLSEGTNVRHGHQRDNRKSPTLACWSTMKQRCLNPKCKKWPIYGGRGIKICPRWMVFSNFLDDMGERPDGLTLDRKDTNGNYEPSNCRWATPKQQSHNMRKNRWFTVNGHYGCMSDLAKLFGVSASLIHYRLSHGWSVDDAFLTRPQS